MNNWMIKQIGTIHTPYKTLEEVPFQTILSKHTSEIEMFEEYKDGLDDVDSFSHLIIMYLLHKSKGYSLRVKPFLDNHLKGVFSTRHPRRPNPIGFSVVELIERKENILKVKGMDVIDGTPLIDIKPYIPNFDCKPDAKAGWLEGKIHE